MFTIKQATLQDHQAITEIYNQAILNPVATFDTEIKTASGQQDLFEQRADRRPILVAEQDSYVGTCGNRKKVTNCIYSNLGGNFFQIYI